MPSLTGRLSQRGLTLVVSLALVTGCATPRPLLDTDARSEQVGEATAQSDIANCVAEAKEQVQSGVEVAGSMTLAVVAGAAAGAGVAAMHTSLPEQIGVAAAAGAIAGAAIGLYAGVLLANQNEAGFKGHVEACLEERGYRLAGWDHGDPDVRR